MSRIIGIDLGTTNSAAGFLSDDGPQLIPNALGEKLTPSVIGLDLEGKLLVGRSARELTVLHPDRCACLFKRRMGSEEKIQVADRQFSATELSSMVLRSLKADAEAHFGETITRAVITVPAYFNDQQRKATMAAGKIAGLEVERIVNEPTAAALAYGFHEAREDKVLLVFDLGGGTFDVSLVELFDGVLEVKASAGEIFLGGEDFTRTLASRILQRHGMNFEHAELESPRRVARLIQQCEVAKCRLSRQESAPVRLPDAKGEISPDHPQDTITRQEFEEWTEKILVRSELPIRRVLGDARLKHHDVDEVLLVGGATRMPAVTALVKRLFLKPPQCRLNPDEVVALGAAVQAGLIGQDRSVEDLVATDVCPFTLGVSVSKLFGTEQRDGYFLPVIQRNTTIPVSRAETVATMYANQPEIKVQIYQGESRKVEENLFLGEFSVRGVPPGPAGQPVQLRFTYDLNGVLEVEATIMATGRKATHVVTRYAKGMTPAQVDKAVKDMSRLKVHPREEEANQYLLRRGERLYQELGLDLRESLGRLLDEFEQALARQDRGVIQQARQNLEIFLSSIDPESEPDTWKPDHDDLE